jgi:eukaryotic-like serine/threonine-protein kinase
MTLAPGTRLGPYEILAPLGAGGMGEVYKAKDTRLDRMVAVKVLPEDLAKSADALARFEREAKAVAALNHPNITGIFDIGRVDDMAYAVMELLEGESLRGRLAQGPLTPRVAIELAIQMAHGLAAAHDKGVIHRDLKPDNLWITTEGRLKILDFGLAKLVASAGRGSESYLATEAGSPGPVAHTEKGMILGTLGYMSPEQVRGETVDARSDIFSFGAVLFEMLTGRKAFARDTASDTMAAILRDDPPESHESSKPIPPALRRIVDHCLEKIPARRFHDAHDLAFALESAAALSSNSSAPFTPPFVPQNWRTSWKWAALATGLLGVAVFAGWALRGGPRPPPTFQRLSFVPGTIESARFGPDGKTVYFSQRVAGGKPDIFVLHTGDAEPKALGIQDALLLDVSPSNELAFLRAPRPAGSVYGGILARAPGGGGALRELQEGVTEAAWDGEGLATVSRADDGRLSFHLDFPAGKRLPSAGEAIENFQHLCLSRDGASLALVHSDTKTNKSEIAVHDRQGQRRVLFTKEGDAWGGTLAVCASSRGDPPEAPGAHSSSRSSRASAMS